MSEKKVLVVCQHFWPETFRLNDICDYLVERGCTIEVLCGIPNYPKGNFFDGYSWFRHRVQTHNGIKIRRAFEVPRGNNSNFRILINYLSFPIASLFHIPRLLFKSYDKIYLYQLSPVMMSFAGIAVGKLRGIETTMYVLDLWPENLFSVLPIKNKILRKLITKISHWHYKRVDKLIVLSDTMKERLAEVTGITQDKIIVLPQAPEKIYEKDVVDTQLSQRYSSGFNVLFAGNISPAQSFETIIVAASILKKQGLKGINWIVVGDGMSRRQVETEVEEAGLSNDFFFEGFKPLEDIPKYNHLADVLVGCLSKSDLLEATIPAKVMSYIAAGKPMALAMDGEVQHLVNDEIQCGLVGPTEDAERLAANLKTIYEMTPKARTDMGRRGRRYHLKHFERNILLAKMYEFIFS